MLSMFSRSPKPAALDARAAIPLVAQGALTLIDIRDPAEIAASGKAKGALAIPLSVIRMKADPRSPECHPDLKTDRPVALYCASGARANMAAQMLREMGYGEVHNLGGLMHWQMAGGEVIR
ncbi:MAG: sulfurtransferase [Rhodobacterales bacterium]|nr:sulfurtransferase [Rhodobacterales bacterium]NCT12016.1 sulfurtransferase [Rhodobacterales bacterium]